MSTFDPSKVLVNFHGFTLGGYADGTFIEAERDSETFSKTVGADGEVAWLKSADDSGTIKFTVLQTSAANDILSAELFRDELTGVAVGPVFIKDLTGRTLVMGAEARLQKPAAISLGKDIEAREWTILVAHLKVQVGGNS